MSISRLLGDILRFASSTLKKQEKQVEKVIEVLAPGPLGIVEHKFTHAEIESARAQAARACEKWSRAASRRQL
ncbi:hypothetical protein R1flu_015334 [Riccia fluitans]|uniref:Uncharacterized protein n=1 Tax=Riccia fluitans TaxID=41844 RepID=A0ABD1YIL6_9MARC